jgi:hypothetical protein
MSLLHITFSENADKYILQYYNRWANHEQSAKLSLDLYVKTEKKMEDMQITSSLTWIEVIVHVCVWQLAQT